MKLGITLVFNDNYNIVFLVKDNKFGITWFFSFSF